MGRGRGVFGGCGGWVCPGARFKAWRGGRGGWLPSRLLRPRTVVLTLTPVEEKATPALPQGCRHSLCQLRDEVGSEISAGPDGPSAREVLEELEQAPVGTDAQRSLFQIRSDFPGLALSLSWYLAFRESLTCSSYTAWRWSERWNSAVCKTLQH